MFTTTHRGNHQDHIGEMEDDALDLDHDTTTSASHALASAGVSSADNPTDLRSLSDDHPHIQAKGNSINQHMNYRAASGGYVCPMCNEIQDIFDFEEGIPARSWRTLDLSAYVENPYETDPPLETPYVPPKNAWKAERHKHNTSRFCSFCQFLMGCASRMAIHTAVDLESNDWILVYGARFFEYRTRNASYLCGPSNKVSRIPILELKLGQSGVINGPLVRDVDEDWEDTHLILPVQAYNDRHGEVFDTIDWELIKEWLATCHTEHDNDYCNDSTPVTIEDIPSFCLIDCETETIIPAAGMRNLQYVTLSYVWGNSTTFPQALNASTSLPVLPDSNHRPKVVNDAMAVVPLVGYQYLWVDRYCIPQSDHDAKSIQIKNMGRIYSMSILTIIAAAGNNAEYGLPGVSSPPSFQQVWTTLRSGNREMPIIYFEPPNRDILRSTWNSRGWTYQEALLSKRRLVFTDRHVYFQCESMQSIGWLGPSKDSDKWPFAAKESGVFPFRMYYKNSSWEQTVWARIDDYTKRMLSFEQDTIYAVQGILESFRDSCDVWFFYGLPIMDSSASDIGNFQNKSAVLYHPRLIGTFWEVDSSIHPILASLLWKDLWNTTVARLSTQESRFCDQANLRRIEFPSWTWAGWKTTNNRVTIRNDLPGYKVTPKYYVPDGFPVEIRVSYDDQCLTWSRDNQEIRRRAENIDQCPNFLIISGPVFDVSITCTAAEHQRTAGPPVWVYSSPTFLRYGTYRGPPFSVNGVKGNTMDFIALYIFSDIDTGAPILQVLILRPVEEDAYGKIYERVTCTFSHLPFLKLADLNLRQMELRIR